MTAEEMSQVQLAITELRSKGFFEDFINEILGLAVKRHILTNEPYIESLWFTVHDELSKCEMGIVGEGDNVTLLPKNVN